jgi:hypothetical protein
MSALFSGPQTPTDLRIRKMGNGGYLIEKVVFDPHAELSCQRNGVKGEVYERLEDAIESVRLYMEMGKGCLCDDCDHEHRTG